SCRARRFGLTLPARQQRAGGAGRPAGGGAGMGNKILFAATLCGGASLAGPPVPAAPARDAPTPASPAPDPADPPASDDDPKKQSGSAVQSVGGNSSTSGMLLPTDQVVGAAPNFGNTGTSTISTNSSLTSISTLSATVSSNGF